MVWSHIYIWTHILLHFFSEIVPAMMIIDVKLSTQLKTANPAAKNPFADQPNPFQVTILSETYIFQPNSKLTEQCCNTGSSSNFKSRVGIFLAATKLMYQGDCTPANRKFEAIRL